MAARSTLVHMANEVMDWDSAYRQEAGFDGPPPWNIGEPQPELAALAAAGRFRSDVLDAGCGYAELSLALAADGYTVHRVDLTPTAIAAATKAAQERRLSSATFEHADITTFGGHDGRLNTVVDSTLSPSLPLEGRDDYLRAVHRAAAPGARYYALVFAKAAFPPDAEFGPNTVDENELRDAVSKHWHIDEIRSAFIHANIPLATPDPPFVSPMPEHDR